MNKAKEVIKRIDSENEVFTIQILGDKKNKSQGFYILMNTQQLYGTANETFHGIKKSTLDLLDEAEIKYEILR